MRNFFSILLIALIAFPLAAWFASGGPRAERSQQHYMMSVSDARTGRLKQGEDAPLRIVLLGGSSLGWGMSAQRLSMELDLPVVNLGLHGGLGYRGIFDLYSDLLSPERDVLVVSPEYEFVRLSQRTTAAKCDYYFVTRNASPATFLCGIRNAISRLSDRLYVALGNTQVDPVYNRNGFNTYGDYTLFYDAATIGLGPPGPQLQMDRDAKAITTYSRFLESLRHQGFNIIYQPVTVADIACQTNVDEINAVHRALSEHAFSHFDHSFPFCAPQAHFYNTVYHPLRPVLDQKTTLLLKTLKLWLTTDRP